MHFILTIIHDLNCVIAHNMIRAFHVLLQRLFTFMKVSIAMLIFALGCTINTSSWVFFFVLVPCFVFHGHCNLLVVVVVFNILFNNFLSLRKMVPLLSSKWFMDGLHKTSQSKSACHPQANNTLNTH